MTHHSVIRPSDICDCSRTQRHNDWAQQVPDVDSVVQSPAAFHVKTELWESRGGSVGVEVKATAVPQQRRVIPTRIEEIDRGRILGFAAELSEDHPGFHDALYKQRRKMISDLATEHAIGMPIERIAYTDEEKETWKVAFRTLTDLYPKHACREFNESFAKFGLSEDDVPQLQDLSDCIYNQTGWSIRPVAGLMHPRDFLNGLAFQTFHSTQYMRHHSKPTYTPEPDLIHEVLGHMPMLANPNFCRLMHSIGVASLGASEKMIWHLTKVYWFTVEFGVVYEGNGVKAFGAGILSSFGEMQWMAEGRAEILKFDPYVPQPRMSYKDGYQKQYFALESFEKGAQLLEEYSVSVRSQQTI